MNRTIALIQARMRSIRLPGKILAEIAGRPMLWHVVNRVRQAKMLDRVAVATSDDSSDDAVVAFCKKEGIPCFRGSEDDVLDRYYQIAKWMNADVIVRITADCPLIDPDTVDKVVRVYMDGNYDYVSNANPPTYPDGLDTEVFSFQTLEATWREAKWLSEREHVTSYVRNHPEMFRIGNVMYEEDVSRMRWTVDEPQDLEFVRTVYSFLEGTVLFKMTDVLSILNKHPELMEINAGIGRNEGYRQSVHEDGLIGLEQ